MASYHVVLTSSAERSLGELVSDTPATEGAVLRVKKLLGKAGPGVAAAVKQVMISVVTEAVKHKLWN